MHIFRSNKILPENTVFYDNNLYSIYSPIEKDPNIDIEYKVKKMEEWWKRSLEALKQSGLSKYHIEEAIKIGNLEFRDGFLDLSYILNKLDIPLVIISASGIGKYTIPKLIEHKGIKIKNLDVISNDLIWNESGKMIGYNIPVIHSFNKSETLVKDYPDIYKKVKNRKNIILIGDSLGDHHMSDGFDYKNILKIGFLNENEDNLIDSYLERYDVVITGDGDLSFLNNILNQFLTEKS